VAVLENPRIRESDTTIRVLPLDFHFLEVDSDYNYGVAIGMGILQSDFHNDPLLRTGADVQ
jgi:hypothetical protein